MLYGYAALGLVLAALWLVAFIDLLTTNPRRTRNLQKSWWVAAVLLLPFVGAMMWLVVGRPTADGVYRGNLWSWGAAPRGIRARAAAPDDDPDFIAQLGAICAARPEPDPSGGIGA